MAYGLKASSYDPLSHFNSSKSNSISCSIPSIRAAKQLQEVSSSVESKLKAMLFLVASKLHDVLSSVGSKLLDVIS